MIRKTLAAVVAGAISFALAIICAWVLMLAVFLGLYLAWLAHIPRLEWAGPPLAFLTTGLVVGAFLLVLFGTVARISTWLRIPRWSGVAAAGVCGGAGAHWLLLGLTDFNAFVFGVSFPYWWMEFEFHFG